MAIHRMPPTQSGEDVQALSTDHLASLITEEILACFSPGSFEHTILAEALRRLRQNPRP